MQAASEAVSDWDRAYSDADDESISDDGPVPVSATSSELGRVMREFDLAVPSEEDGHDAHASSPRADR